jgi:hypothetical protein
MQLISIALNKYVIPLESEKHLGCVEDNNQYLSWNPDSPVAVLSHFQLLPGMMSFQALTKQNFSLLETTSTPSQWKIKKHIKFYSVTQRACIYFLNFLFLCSVVSMQNIGFNQ